jgi:hypothetical protein
MRLTIVQSVLYGENYIKKDVHKMEDKMTKKMKAPKKKDLAKCKKKNTRDAQDIRNAMCFKTKSKVRTTTIKKSIKNLLNM